MAQTSIEWTDVTWNVARGCTKVDADCKYCYMMRDSLNDTRYPSKQVVRTKTVFDLPLKIQIPSRIFTSSLTDFFHPEIDGYRHEAWDIIRKCPQHTFQILTKRPERIGENLPPDWGEGWNNVWLGTSVGSQDSIHRITKLLESAPAKCFFASLEPLIGEIDLIDQCVLYKKRRQTRTINYLDWVIVGGESGNENGKYRYRPCDFQWIEKIVSQCKVTDTPVFVKQLGTHLSKTLKLSDRHGRDMNEWPEHLDNLKIRQFPQL